MKAFSWNLFNTKYVEIFKQDTVYDLLSPLNGVALETFFGKFFHFSKIDKNVT